jgi:hypothetical protein
MLALQSEVEAMRQGRHEYVKKLQRSPASGEDDGAYQSIQENKQIIVDLKRRLAESEERERSRALYVAAEREERRHAEVCDLLDRIYSCKLTGRPHMAIEIRVSALMSPARVPAIEAREG